VRTVAPLNSGRPTYVALGRSVCDKGNGHLKIVPKKKIELTEFFDRADLGMNLEEWGEFERRFYTDL